MADRFQEDFLEQVSKLLKYHNSLGIREYPRTKALDGFLKKQKESPPSRPRVTQQRAIEAIPKSSGKKHFFDAGLAQKATLHDVREEIGDCHRCGLHKTRTNIVFGHGPERAGLMIIADAPGKEDDLVTAPLQGEEGELLDRMLHAIKLSRDQVYITTLVKCFPGDNAKPAESEMRTCLPFLFRQIEIVCPQVICTMGIRSSQILLHSSKSLFQLRGRFYNFNDLCTDKLAGKIVVMPSLYPSLLLENEELKKASWQDLQLIQKKLEEKRH
jgi:DNA polymerase